MHSFPFLFVCVHFHVYSCLPIPTALTERPYLRARPIVYTGNINEVAHSIGQDSRIGLKLPHRHLAHRPICFRLCMSALVRACPHLFAPSTFVRVHLLSFVLVSLTESPCPSTLIFECPRSFVLTSACFAHPDSVDLAHMHSFSGKVLLLPLRGVGDNPISDQCL